MTTSTAQVVSLNCGHQTTVTNPQALATHHVFACLTCFNYGGFEGARYIAGDEPGPQIPEVGQERAEVEPGAFVRYHGSLVAEHGEYRVVDRCDCDDGLCDSWTYIAYRLERLDGSGGLRHVQRVSFTAVR